MLAELRADPPEAVVIGGDVAAGPMPVEVLARLRRAAVAGALAARQRRPRVVMSFDGTVPPELARRPHLDRRRVDRRRASPRAERDLLDGLAPLVRLEVEGLGDVLFCHGTPRSDEERVTVFTPEPRLAEILGDGGAPLVVGGHTHRQFDMTAGGRRMVNAGSVGRPHEHEPGAYWLRLGPDVRLRRTAYDTGAAAAAFGALGYPEAATMLAPVDPDDVAARLEAAAAEPVAEASRV